MLLADSLFVKTFRSVAFDNALDQRDMHTLRGRLPPNPFVRVISEAVYTNPGQQIAQKDAQRFNLTKALFIRFKARHFPATSDYFKPGAADASNPALLNDSAYVQTFRFEAYSKSYHQSSLKHGE